MEESVFETEKIAKGVGCHDARFLNHALHARGTGDQQYLQEQMDGMFLSAGIHGCDSMCFLGGGLDIRYLCPGHRKESPIAVSTLGVKDIRMFLDGYHYFLEKIQPDYILCYGKRIKGMTGNIISFSYEDAFMPNRYGQQLRLFEVSRLSVIKKEDE